MRHFNKTEQSIIEDLKPTFDDLIKKRLQLNEELKLVMGCQKDICLYIMKRLDINKNDMVKILYA